MKIFLFSKRFFIPFLIVFFSHLSYLLWDIWELYKDDFENKGLPFSIKFKWVLAQANGSFLILSFAAASLIGGSFYSHYKMKDKNKPVQLFSFRNLILVILIALAGFIYTSFFEPRIYEKSATLLMAVIYSEMGSDVQKEMNRSHGTVRNERMLSLPELFAASDSVKNRNKQDQKSKTPFFSPPAPDNTFKKMDFMILKKMNLPFLIASFYIIAALVGVSLYRLHVIFSLLISYFLFFIPLSYGLIIFELLYKINKVNMFIGATGMTLVFAVIIVFWLVILKRWRVFKRTAD